MTPIRPLTVRQEQVVRLLARGMSYREIGEELGAKPRTVEAHVHAVALLLPNPDRLPAKTLVQLWAVREAA